jgi:hypothetical protein
MTAKTLVDELFAPILPSLKLWFYKKLKATALAQKYKDLEEEKEFRRMCKEIEKQMQAKHKVNTEKLDKLCFKVKGLDYE